MFTVMFLLFNILRKIKCSFVHVYCDGLFYTLEFLMLRKNKVQQTGIFVWISSTDYVQKPAVTLKRSRF